GGVLVTVPVPEEAELPREIAEEAIEQALSAAEEQGVKGKALTPFLLSQMARITEGKSLAANIALLENNAVVAARIARALALWNRGARRNQLLSDGYSTGLAEFSS
ncbi:MAG: pseudouridine-5'-phosphate glycosidase, partial [Chloroflexota bacterium]|nr:pseudouridine-5'-phosphate glycosidase [Chloroflexota bacterium]